MPRLRHDPPSVADPLPSSVRRFIAEHIESVGELELLLLLAAAPDKLWTPEELGRALVTGEEAAHTHLARLVAHGLVTDRGGTFAFTAGPKATAVDELAECYAKRRHSVIGVIYGSDERGATTISDAFRVRRRKT